MTRILVPGKTGQVGWELQSALAPLGTVIALDRRQIDLSNPDSIRKAIRKAKPGIIVNAAGYTAVDKAETEPELVMQVNGVAPGIMAEEARRLGAILIHFSTDYVFDGKLDRPYTEYPLPAKRPRHPVTNKDKIKQVFGVEMPHWENQLRAFLAGLPGPASRGGN